MARRTAPLLPVTEELLRQLGDRLRLARKRRRLSIKHAAERAGMAPMTLRSLERGGAGVTIGAYLAVMQVLGIERDLDLLAKEDPLGRALQDSRLSARKKATARVPPVSMHSTGRKQTRTTDIVLPEQLSNSSSSVQPLNMSGRLPIEQVHKALRAVPEEKPREATADLSSQPPSRGSDVSTRESMNTWIEKGSFASSRKLADLIENVPSPRTKKR